MAHTFDANIEAADEAFWQKQEVRKRGYLGQPCCTQSKMSWALTDIPGAVAVVVHGEFDCLNCFHHHTGVGPHRFYSSRLSEHQIMTGEVGQPLEHLLRLLVAERQPEAIVVLGTCPVEVISDRFEVVAERVAADTGTPIVALHTSGLKLTSLTDCIDWLMDALASLPPVPQPAPSWFDVAVSPEAPTVNVLGLPGPARELVEVLSELDVGVHGFFPQGATLTQWRSMGASDVAVAVDKRVYKKLVQRLEGPLEQPVIDVGLPIGLAACEGFYGAIGAGVGRHEQMAQVLHARRVAAHAQIAAWREAHGGVKLGMAIRMLNTYQMDRIVLDGLGELSHLLELGFNVTLFVQGPLEEGPRFAERLRTTWNLDLPVVPFEGPWALPDALLAHGMEVAHAPDSSRSTIRRAGLPVIASRSLKPWFSGLSHNLRALADLVAQRRVA